MRWIARSTGQGYEAKWWPDDAGSRPVRFDVPENTVDAWRLAARRLDKEWPNLLRLPPDVFRTCEFFSEFPSTPESREKGRVSEAWAAAVLDRMMFCKFVLAIHREKADRSAAASRSVLDTIVTHTRFLVSRWPYGWIVWSEYSATLDKRHPIRDAVEAETWEYALEHLCQRENSTDALADFLDGQDLLHEVVRHTVLAQPEIRQTIEDNHANLLEATVHFLEAAQQRASENRAGHASPIMLRFSRQHRPGLCCRLAAHSSLPLDERRQYLEKFFEQHLPYGEERLLLYRVLTDPMHRDEAGDKADATTETLASLMAQHYLDQYLLDDAVAIWERVLRVKQDSLLKRLLDVYRRPRRYVILIVALLILSFVHLLVAGQGWRILAQLPAAVLLLTAAFVTVYALTTITKRLVTGQGFSYLELLLPRLLGSIVVGLSILALESTVWQATLTMPWFNWALITLASFGGALVYFFLDVHKSTRLLPVDTGRQESSAPTRDARNPMARSVQTTFKVFAIGVLEALGLTTLISSLLPLHTIGAETPLLSLSWLKVLQIGDLMIFEVTGEQCLVLMYSPRLIVLWAGLALLIGAFAQLLWQDRRITAS